MNAAGVAVGCAAGAAAEAAPRSEADMVSYVVCWSTVGSPSLPGLPAPAATNAGWSSSVHPVPRQHGPDMDHRPATESACGADRAWSV